MALLPSLASGQTAPPDAQFEVASVKVSERLLGPDYNNQLTFSPSAFRARNATLRRLIAEAWGLQVNQIIGARGLDEAEFDIAARAGGAVARERLLLMLRSLLADRFGLRQHGETRNMRAYELVVDQGGPRIQPTKSGDEPVKGPGFHFHGDMKRLADLVAIQLTIPETTDPTRPAVAGGAPATVLDKTGLAEVYDFDFNESPEFGTDGFTVWQRRLRDWLGLRLESRQEDVPVLVVDRVAPVPNGN